MSVRAAVVKPMRMVVPCCRPNKVIGAKLHITGAVRKGSRPSLACAIDSTAAMAAWPSFCVGSSTSVCAWAWSQK